MLKDSKGSVLDSKHADEDANMGVADKSGSSSDTPHD